MRLGTVAKKGSFKGAVYDAISPAKFVDIEKHVGFATICLKTRGRQ